jgi:hypothetical protein
VDAAPEGIMAIHKGIVVKLKNRGIYNFAIESPVIYGVLIECL